MRISASIENRQGSNQVTLKTNDHQHSIIIPTKPSGLGSHTNGGELLFLALATCYCNDIYREAAKKKIKVLAVEVTVEGDFGLEGEPAKNIIYSAKVHAQGAEREIEQLLYDTDKVAEIQNTVRIGTSVTLKKIEVVRE